MKPLHAGALTKAKKNDNATTQLAAHTRDHRGHVLADLGSKESNLIEIIAVKKSKVLRLVNIEFSAWMFYGCLVVSSFSGLFLLRLMRSDGLDKKSIGNLGKGGRSGAKQRSEASDIQGHARGADHCWHNYANHIVICSRLGAHTQSSWGGLHFFGMHTL